MASEEDIRHQWEMLRSYRITLAHYLRQRAQLGTAHEPPALGQGIIEARQNIKYIKANLRNMGEEVPDNPIDDMPSFDRSFLNSSEADRHIFPTSSNKNPSSSKDEMFQRIGRIIFRTLDIFDEKIRRKIRIQAKIPIIAPLLLLCFFIFLLRLGAQQTERQTRQERANNILNTAVWEPNIRIRLLLILESMNHASEDKSLMLSAEDLLRRALFDANQLQPALVPPFPAPFLIGHAGHVRSVVWKQDDTQILSGGDDATARVWEVFTGNQKLMLKGHSDVIYTARWDEREEQIETLSADATLRTWDARTGEEYKDRQIQLPPKVRALNISPNNRWLLLGGKDDWARLCDLTTITVAQGNSYEMCAQQDISETGLPPTGSGLGVSSLQSYGLRGYDVVGSVAFSSNSHWLVTGSSDGLIRLWNLLAPNPVARPDILIQSGPPLRGVMFSPDSSLLAVGSSDGMVRLWKLNEQGALPRPIILKGELASTNAIGISSNNYWLATGGEDGLVRLWDLRSLPTSIPKTFIELRGHQGFIRSIAFNPDSTMLATASSDGTIRLWPAMNLTQLRELGCRAAGRNLTDEEWQKFTGLEKAPQTCPA